MNVMVHKEEVGKISTEATQESLLEELLQKIRNQWASAEFVCLPFKEQKEVYILGGVDEIQVATPLLLQRMQEPWPLFPTCVLVARPF